MLRITLVLLIVGAAVAQLKSTLSCPYLETVKDFNVNLFGGKWYQYAMYGEKDKIDTKCVTATYSPNKDGSFDVKYSQTQLKGKITYATQFRATPRSKSGQFRLSPTAAPYHVLLTDYQTWALLWSCENFKGGSTRNSRILTRESSPRKVVIDWIEAGVKLMGIHINRFIITSKEGCPPSYFERRN